MDLSDPTDEVTAVVEEYVAERDSSTEVVEVEITDGVTQVDVVVATSLASPPVNPLAVLLADQLTSPVELRLLGVSSETKRATVEP